MEHLIGTTKGVVDYISVADPETMEETSVAKRGALVSLAVFFGKTRLIDTIVI